MAQAVERLPAYQAQSPLFNPCTINKKEKINREMTNPGLQRQGQHANLQNMFKKNSKI
jgi:hypothetical protein